MTRPAFSLLETLLAAALLALVVAACLPLLVRSPAPAPVRPDAGLLRFAAAPDLPDAPNLGIERSPSVLAGGIEGTWVVVRVGDRVAVAWVPAEPTDAEDEL